MAANVRKTEIQRKSFKQPEKSRMTWTGGNLVEQRSPGVSKTERVRPTKGYNKTSTRNVIESAFKKKGK